MQISLDKEDLRSIEEESTIDFLFSSDSEDEKDVCVTLQPLKPIYDKQSNDIDLESALFIEDRKNKTLFCLDPNVENEKKYEELFLTGKKTEDDSKSIKMVEETLAYLNALCKSNFPIKNKTIAFLFIMFNHVLNHKGISVFGCIIINLDDVGHPTIVDIAIESIDQYLTFGIKSVSWLLDNYECSDIFYNINERNDLVNFFEKNSHPVIFKHKEKIKNLFDSFYVAGNVVNVNCCFQFCINKSNKFIRCPGCYLAKMVVRLFGANTIYKQNIQSPSNILLFNVKKYNFTPGIYQMGNKYGNIEMHVKYTTKTPMKRKFKDFKTDISIVQIEKQPKLENNSYTIPNSYDSLLNKSNTISSFESLSKNDLSKSIDEQSLLASTINTNVSNASTTAILREGFDSFGFDQL